MCNINKVAERNCNNVQLWNVASPEHRGAAESKKLRNIAQLKGIMPFVPNIEL